ncbi:carboxymuconolactone decarboxylase family protein [Lacibacter sp. H407]|uniref:carboxymuconolactone decarboxylase family protein n=1 Tax=Lacibacter sp. H407 TaxID=3133423 RepID=UPI0030C22E9E
MHTNESLYKKQQSIVLISAFTAKGDQLQLHKALNDGLDAGLTVNDVKEVLVQLYAYAGFPRSLNALNSFMSVLKERKQKGINDVQGKEPKPLPTNQSKLQFGTEMQTKLVGQPVKGEVYTFAPAIDQFLKEHLFGDIFGRDNIDWKTREIATIAALAGLGGAENQLRSHFNVGIYNGLTEQQLVDLVSIIHTKVSTKDGIAANEVLKTVLKQNPTAIPIHETNNNKLPAHIFPTGDKITNNNFTGTAYLQPLVASDSLNQTSVGNVTFEPGARTNWHYHPGGQILLVIDGVGYYQEKGSPKKILRKGDTVKCPPNVVHWHGASVDSAFVQVAITNTQKSAVVWLKPVTDEEYRSNNK